VLLGIAAVSLIYGWWHGQLDWHSLLNVGAAALIALSCLMIVVFRELRKRASAGILGFQSKHRPVDAVGKLKAISHRYLYIGRSFESMLGAFQEARGKNGMAQTTQVRLLLSNPDD
jgi:hypothetical protein